MLRITYLAYKPALNLTADEIQEILSDNNSNNHFDNILLTLENVSMLYRHGLLAKALNISTHDLLSLKRFSGLDIFKTIEPFPITSLEQDHPFKQTIEFVKGMVEEVKESGFKTDDLNFLLRHHFDDPLGKYRVKMDSSILPLIQGLGSRDFSNSIRKQSHYR